MPSTGLTNGYGMSPGYHHRHHDECHRITSIAWARVCTGKILKALAIIGIEVTVENARVSFVTFLRYDLFSGRKDVLGFV